MVAFVMPTTPTIEMIRSSAKKVRVAVLDLCAHLLFMPSVDWSYGCKRTQAYCRDEWNCQVSAESLRRMAKSNRRVEKTIQTGQNRISWVSKSSRSVLEPTTSRSMYVSPLHMPIKHAHECLQDRQNRFLDGCIREWGPWRSPSVLLSRSGCQGMAPPRRYVPSLMLS